VNALFALFATTGLAEVVPTPAGSATPASAPILQITGAGAVVLIAISVAVVSTVLLLPFILDLIRSYNQQRQSWDLLVKDMAGRAIQPGQPPNVDELKQLLRAVAESPTGTKGLVRALLAFGIIVIVGGALVATLVSGSSDSADLRKTIIASLLSVLATIIGFYFGSRTAETAGGAKPNAAEPTPLRVGSPPSEKPRVDEGPA